METVVVELSNNKALKLLKELEALHLIRLTKQSVAAPKKKKLSDKYRGVLSKQQGAELNKHIKQMRGVWSNWRLANAERIC